jgi:hypothetical protein
VNQGIRLLSFLPAMMLHSAPMQVAAALGMTMVAPDLVRQLADRLKALPAWVERIVFNALSVRSLIRPRFVPNLMPSPEHPRPTLGLSDQTPTLSAVTQNSEYPPSITNVSPV